jgi:hypothetical protein
MECFQKCIQKLYDVHYNIKGIVELEDNKIATYGYDGVIKIFKINI